MLAAMQPGSEERDVERDREATQSEFETTILVVPFIAMAYLRTTLVCNSALEAELQQTTQDARINLSFFNSSSEKRKRFEPASSDLLCDQASELHLEKSLLNRQKEQKDPFLPTSTLSFSGLEPSILGIDVRDSRRRKGLRSHTLKKKYRSD
jgi:hypothetical protein